MIDKQRDDLLAEQLTTAFNNAVTRLTPHDLFPHNLSVLSMGHPCDRNLWYRFRHATVYAPRPYTETTHKRNIREMIIGVLGEISKHSGNQVKPMKQDEHRFSIINGHFTGKTEAIAVITEDATPVEFVVFVWASPTGLKFRDVSEAGLERGKPEQYKILCALAHNLGIPRAIYVAYNKNDDSVYIEVITADIETAEAVNKRAESVIYATMPPPRISETAAWHTCKACPANDICHPVETEPVVRRSCWTCKNAYPYPDGVWHCGHFNAVIPAEWLERGCEDGYTQIQL